MINEYSSIAKITESALKDKGSKFYGIAFPISNLAEFKTQMAREFNTSKQNVMMALKGYNQSELAKKVRARAKVLLQEEANNVTI